MVATHNRSINRYVNHNVTGSWDILSTRIMLIFALETIRWKKEKHETDCEFKKRSSSGNFFSIWSCNYSYPSSFLFL
ncbi:hypothetical protein ES703_36903 [subsurface metagenome]